MPHKRLARQKKMDFRLHVWRFSAIILFFVILGGLFFFQIMRGDRYTRLAADNRFRLLRMPPPRGLIYDAQGLPLAKNVRTFDIQGYPLNLYKEGALERVAELFRKHGIPADTEELYRRVKRQYWAPYRAVSLASNLTLMQVTDLLGDMEFPSWLFPLPLWKRIYPAGSLAVHVTGYVGEVTEEELREGRGVGYGVGEQIGKTGVEAYYDAYLRGDVGEEAIEVDARGRRLHLLARREPQRGEDLHLTLDLGAQKLAEKLMMDMRGVLFAMDVYGGDVLVLYSSPGYDPNLFSWGATSGEWKKIRTDPGRPMLNRVIGGHYPPASLFKVVPAVAGLASGQITSRSTAFCGGSYQVGNRAFRCWNRWGHGTENLKEALRDSCDVFFYHYGLAMGVDLMADWASRLGMGKPTGIDLTGELSGTVAGREWKQRYRKEPWYPGDTANYSIGQGFLLITPVQIGVMYAALANGGYLVEPRVAFEKEPVSEDLHISADIIKTLREALVAVCKPGGTGFRAGQFGISVAGKTGTAEHDHGEDHAWFAGYAPAEAPRYVVVTLVPGGGHGSSAAAPLAGEMLSYLCKGYLEDKEE